MFEQLYYLHIEPIFWGYKIVFYVYKDLRYNFIFILPAFIFYYEPNS